MINVLVDFSNVFGVARDQGCRPTCIAFAASDAHSHWRDKHIFTHLSPEYAFYFAAQRQLPTTHLQGVRTGAIFDAIAIDGQPAEEHFPYQHQGTSVDPLTAPKIPFLHPTYKNSGSYKHGNTSDVVSCLQKNVTPVLAINITRAFQRASKIAAIVEDHPVDMQVGAHAVVAVGHGKGIDGKEYIKIRNSWGDGWGDSGHAWLSEAYLNRRMNWLATYT